MRLFMVSTGVFLAVSGLWQPRARACSCLSQSPEQAFASSAAVFEGQVLETRPEPATGVGSLTRVRVRLRVVQSWKGIKGEEITVLTPSASEACGYKFQAGQSYLVYASSAGSDMIVSSCGLTKPVAQAETELKGLGMGTITVNPEPTVEEKKVYSDPAAPRPRPAGCASCRVGESRQTPSPTWPLFAIAAACAWYLRRKRFVIAQGSNCPRYTTTADSSRKTIVRPPRLRAGQARSGSSCTHVHSSPARRLTRFYGRLDRRLDGGLNDYNVSRDNRTSYSAYFGHG